MTYELTTEGQPVRCDGCLGLVREDQVEGMLIVPAPAYLYGPGFVYVVHPGMPWGSPSACLFAAKARDAAWWRLFGCGDENCRGCAPPEPEPADVDEGADRLTHRTAGPVIEP